MRKMQRNDRDALGRVSRLMPRCLASHTPDDVQRHQAARQQTDRPSRMGKLQPHAPGRGDLNGYAGAASGDDEDADARDVVEFEETESRWWCRWWRQWRCCATDQSSGSDFGSR